MTDCIYNKDTEEVHIPEVRAQMDRRKMVSVMDEGSPGRNALKKKQFNLRFMEFEIWGHLCRTMKCLWKTCKWRAQVNA
jgi:hypothetical protein